MLSVLRYFYNNIGVMELGLLNVNPIDVTHAVCIKRLLYPHCAFTPIVLAQYTSWPFRPFGS